MKRGLYFWACSLAVVGCTATALRCLPATAPESGDVERACVHLQALGCKEGMHENCASSIRAIMTEANDTGLFPVDVACVLDAGTVQAVRGCRGFTCP
jgi:hypothetical protein